MKQKKCRKKSCKGMTLVEILIAMAVFAMLGVTLAAIGTHVDKTMTATVDLNRRILEQVPIAETRREVNTEVLNETNTEGSVSVANGMQVVWSDTVSVKIDAAERGTYAETRGRNADGTYNGDTAQSDLDAGNVNGGIHLRYYLTPDQLISPSSP